MCHLNVKPKTYICNNNHVGCSNPRQQSNIDCVVSPNHTIPQTHVLWLYGYASTMNRTDVDIVEHFYKKGFSSLMHGQDGSTLKAKSWFYVLSDFSQKSLKRKFSNQKISGFLILPDLTECDSPRTVSTSLLDTPR